MVALGGLLPPIGLEIPCSAYAVNVPLKINVLGVVTADFKGGFRVRVEANLSTGLGGVKFKMIGLEYRADSPVLGSVVITQSDVDTTSLSLLEVVGNLPPKFKNTLFWDVDMIVEKPPGGGPPMTLRSTRPMTMVNENLSVFPPQGSVYQLMEPIDFAPIGTPSQVVAQLLQFPLTVSHNP